MHHKVLLLTILAVIRSNGFHNSSKMSLILDSLPELCPDANICIENDTLQKQEYMPTSSCCSECSCHSNCAENNDCCFPTRLPHFNDDGHYTEQTKHSCLFPVTPLLADIDMIFYQSYIMVDTVQKGVALNDNSNSNMSCGEVSVAPWGTLYPVYSSRMKKIYKNMVCALADGATDGENWDAILACDNRYKDASNYVTGLDSNHLPYSCSVDFVYRGNVGDLNSLKCFDDFVSKCLSDFSIPIGLELSKNDVVNLCESSFISPYRVIKNYANVFCYICNDQSLIKDLRCETTGDTKFIKDRGWGFLGLLDENFLKKNKKPTAEYLRVCIGGNVEHCRLKLCPSGQLRDTSGMCRYPHKLWYYQSYTVFVNLTSKSSISFTDIFELSIGMPQNYLPPFRSPWPRNWFIYYIMANRETLNGTSKQISLLLMIKTKKITVKPKEFVKAVGKFAKENWYLQRNGSTLTFTSQFAPYSSVDMAKREDDQEFIHGQNSNEIDHYTTLYKQSRFQLNDRSITKLDFCDQVEMKRNEVIFSRLKGIVFNKITARHFFDGEFAIVQSNAYEGLRVRICLEDSDKTEKVTSSGVEINSKMIFMWLFSTGLLHIIYH